MKFNLLNKKELDVLNRRTLKYPLAIAEKDYFLTLVSKIIYQSKLKDKLVFKGGTALHHCYLPLSTIIATGRLGAFLYCQRR
ncbi:MAG: hypothetical protein ABH896_00540 [Candidatus Jacksonbacteria bacterium]